MRLGGSTLSCIWLPSHTEAIHRRNVQKQPQKTTARWRAAPVRTSRVRTQDVELIRWLRAPLLNARGSCAGWDTQSHCKATARNSLIHEEKSVQSGAPPPTSSPLWSAQTAKKVQGKNSKHTPCLLTPWWNSSLTHPLRVGCGSARPDFRFEGI